MRGLKRVVACMLPCCTGAPGNTGGTSSRSSADRAMWMHHEGILVGVDAPDQLEFKLGHMTYRSHHSGAK